MLNITVDILIVLSQITFIPLFLFTRMYLSSKTTVFENSTSYFYKSNYHRLKKYASVTTDF